MQTIDLETIFVDFSWPPGWVGGGARWKQGLMEGFQGHPQQLGTWTWPLGRDRGFEHFNLIPPAQLCLRVEGQDLAWSRGKERERREAEKREESRKAELQAQYALSGFKVPIDFWSLNVR